MRWSIERTLPLGFGLMLAVLLGNALVLNTSIRALRENFEELGRSRRIVAALEATQVAIIDAETGQRGFLLTGREEYLEPYRRALPRIDASLAELRVRLADQPPERIQLARLEARIADKLAIQREAIERRQAAGLDGALTVVASGRGKAVMDEIRGLLDDLKADEQGLRMQRVQQSRSSLRRTAWTFVVATAVALILLCAVMYLVRHDIAERRRAEEELRRWEQIFRHAGWGVAIVDPAGHTLRAVNPAFAAMHGLDEEQLRGRPLEDVVAPEVRPDLPRRARAVGERGHLVYESVHLRGDGSRFPVLTDETAIRGEGGRVLYRAANFQDITTRKDAEAALRRARDELEARVAERTAELADANAALRAQVAERQQAEAAVRESEERYRLLAENATDMISRHAPGPEGTYLYVSPAGRALLGYEPEGLLGLSPYELIHPEDRPAVAHEHAAAVEAPGVHRVTFRIRHHDGHYLWVETTGRVVRDERTGRPRELHCSTRDVSARVEAEERLRAQNERLHHAVISERLAHEELKRAEAHLVQAEKLSALGQMVAGVAHEINNPLSFVINNVAVLQRDVAHLGGLLRLYAEGEPALAEAHPELYARLRDRAEEIDLAYTLENLERLMDRAADGLRRIGQIVKDLRDFARLDEGDLKDVDLNQGITSTLNIISGRAKRQDVAVATDLAPLPPITCYPGKVNQVVLNLLANAIDATPAGGTVTVRTRPAADGGAEIHVEDSGPGVPPAIRDRIFDPFFTTKPIGQGTGLGLSISYGIVQDHGGTIAVASAPGGGALFTIHLPPRPTPQDPR